MTNNNNNNNFKPLKKVKWGIIGCGDVTEIKSGPAFNLVDDSELVAVMRRNGSLAKDYAERHNVKKWYSDASELLKDPDINAIYISTPPSSHAKYTILAAEAGKHIYVEKPMACSYIECQNMIDASKKNNVELFVAYYRRYLPPFLKIKSLIDGGEIGDLRCVNIILTKKEISFINNDIPWRFKKEIAGGGLFVDLGSHQIDLLDFYFGEIIDFNGFSANNSKEYNVEDSVTASFKFTNNMIGSGTWNFAVSDNSAIDKIEIIGNKGMISFSTFAFSPIEHTNEKGSEFWNYPKPKHVQKDMISQICKHLTGKIKLQNNLMSAARTTQIIESLLK